MKYVFLGLLVFLFSACVENTPKPADEKKFRYIEFEDYNKAVIPWLDKGYEEVLRKKDRYKRNVTPEEIVAHGKRIGADLVMVDSEFGIDEFIFDIVYLKKRDTSKMVFGAKLIEMPAYIRQKFNSNMGCTLGQVFYDTPAYNYDLHQYDIVTEANDETITSCQHFKKILQKSKSKIDLKIWADGEKITIDGIILNKETNTFIL